MQETPPAGGDTLWVSGYELYDRASPPMQKFLESLTAECAQPVFKSACEAGKYDVMSPRGSPLNKDYEFAPHHPVVRTHPVTGWKSLFAGVGLHVSKIDGLWAHEEQMIRDYCLRLVTRNHDCIARMHWTTGACAIWSNACTLHAATVSVTPIALRICALLTVASLIRILLVASEPACGLLGSARCPTWIRQAPAGGRLLARLDSTHKLKYTAVDENRRGYHILVIDDIPI